ncbi:acyltransferase family protein [Hyphococcus sp. DH-69]|uniref:acyltransferase family protein n=1 Tax=Hyphococcus formosus TaxID=3143534 RepID=UPI00398A571D
MTTNHDAYLARSYFPGLDGVRAIAIIAVVWHHCVRADFLPIMSRGFAGVDLFFVLSGFLIATLLIREKAKSGAISLRNFWARRFLRLMPAYYLLLFSLLAAYMLLKPNDPNAQRFIEGFHIYALYLSNWYNPGTNNMGITWSLSTEEQFYLVWPLIESFAAPFFRLGFWIFAIFINQLINFGIFDTTIQNIFGPGAHEKEILESTFTPILFGVALAHILDNPKYYEWVRRTVGFKYAPIATLGFLIALMNIPASDISGLFRLAMHLGMTAWIAAIVIQPQSELTRTLEWRPIALIGAISYGMYLYHMWCIHIVRVLIDKVGLSQNWLQFPLSLALTTLVAAGSYYLYEKRFLNWRKKFRK